MPHPINTDGLKELARGAFGTVYLLESGKVVKVTNPVSPKNAKRSLRELQVWAKTMHSGVCVELERMGRKEVNGKIQFMYVMHRYTEDLTQHLQNEGRLELTDCVEILESISQSLFFLHCAYGIIHRDLHSGNILKQDVCEISDLGLAVLECDLVSCGEDELMYYNTMGTNSVLAERIRPPEVDDGGIEKIGFPTDIYAFGILMFQVLTGKDITICPPQIILKSRALIPIGDFDGLYANYRRQQLLLEIMSKCLDSDPNRRPTAFQLWFCISICSCFDQRHLEFVENLRWDEMGNLRSSSRREGSVFISKKGSSWIMGSTDQIMRSGLIVDLSVSDLWWDLSIFTESGSLLHSYNSKFRALGGWDCSGLPTNVHLPVVVSDVD
eukprot:TRINITY_DN135_c0_g1_i1.p1 TRINITY_DN135_c0_g1~~TRINITY_DN135_c0_g1_i1.p1  ORF type:complete len:383 (-),score=77.98 TRINITY_DN135_c0_g1_i1:106-1254(-)